MKWLRLRACQSRRSCRSRPTVLDVACSGRAETGEPCYYWQVGDTVYLDDATFGDVVSFDDLRYDSVLGLYDVRT